MIAINGPLKGKEYFNIPDTTKTLIDYYSHWETFDDGFKYPTDFFEVTYKRTDKGWKCIQQKKMTGELVEIREA